MANARLEKAEEGYQYYHSIGLYPDKEREMRDELALFARQWCAPNAAQWDYAGAAIAEYLALWRGLIKAPETSMTTAENVTAALYSIFGGIAAERLAGRRVLIAGDCFPSMHFLLSRMARSRGFVLDTVPLRQGESYVREEDMIAHWDEDVAVALITWITSTSSKMAHLAPLVAHGRRQGSLIGVDITQGAGVVPFDVGDPEIDFAISTSLKWICGAPGAGMIYVRPAIIDQFEPEFCGWFSQEDPFDWQLDAFAYAPDSRRFNNGTPAVIPCVASLPGLRWHAQTGIEVIRRHNLALSRKIVETAQSEGWSLVSPADERQRGGSVMIDLPGRLDPAAVVARLRERGVTVDTRGSVLRASPGPVTTPAGVEMLCDTLKELMRS